MQQEIFNSDSCNQSEAKQMSWTCNIRNMMTWASAKVFFFRAWLKLTLVPGPAKSGWIEMPRLICNQFMASKYVITLKGKHEKNSLMSKFRVNEMKHL